MLAGHNDSAVGKKKRKKKCMQVCEYTERNPFLAKVFVIGDSDDGGGVTSLHHFGFDNESRRNSDIWGAFQANVVVDYDVVCKWRQLRCIPRMVIIVEAEVIMAVVAHTK